MARIERTYLIEKDIDNKFSVILNENLFADRFNTRNDAYSYILDSMFLDNFDGDFVISLDGSVNTYVPEDTEAFTEE